MAEITRLYGPPEQRNAPSATPEELWAPHGTYLVLEEGGVPVAGGGVKRLADGLAEVKRMYVVPAARGRGISRLVLAGLEAEALSRGWTTLRLETGPRQPEAIALYTAAGYTPVGAFGHYLGEDAVGSLFFARSLA